MLTTPATLCPRHHAPQIAATPAGPRCFSCLSEAATAWQALQGEPVSDLRYEALSGGFGVFASARYLGFVRQRARHWRATPTGRAVLARQYGTREQAAEALLGRAG